MLECEKDILFKLRYWCFLFLVFPLIIHAQEGGFSRGSIPAELLRPVRGEAPRYPVDMVIGVLGQGNSSDDAYSFANSVARALLARNMNTPVFSGISSNFPDNYSALLAAVDPRGYRLGGGREQADGSVSYLVRFIGRNQAVTGELYIRYITQAPDNAKDAANKNEWVFEELILEEAKSREEEKKSSHRYDFLPYERFF
jgi:hypothetical protein